MPKRSASAQLASASDPSPALRPLPLRDRFRSTLERDSVVEILSHLHRHRAEGTLTLTTSDGVVKCLWARDGHALFATSSHRGDSLWAFLLRERMMPLDLLREVAFERANTNRRYGALLLERGLISPRVLHQTIQRQLEQIIRSFFDVEAGAVDLVLGPIHQIQPIQVALELPRLILDGSRRGPAAASWRERLGGADAVLSAETTPERLIDLGIDENELALLHLVDGKRPVAEVCAKGPFEPDENGRLLYALASLGLLGPTSEA